MLADPSFQGPQDNPFQSPQNMPSKHDAKFKPGVGRGYVNQVPIIATLLLVQGALMFLMALIFAMNSVMFTQFDMFAMETLGGPQPDPEAQKEIAQMGRIVFWATGILGAVVCLLGILHIVAGILAFQYRGRRLTIVTLVLGLSGIVTCYCAPTSIGLLVYGLIIYMHPAVKRAFVMKKSGLSNSDIQSLFFH